jgi:hypothetical protein
MGGSSNRRLVVWLSVAPDQEEAFNRWYQDEYIPRFLMQIPGIKKASRWRVPDSSIYLTIYDLEAAEGFDDVVAALRSPERDRERNQWLRWQHSALTDFRDGLFEETFTLEPSRDATS